MTGGKVKRESEKNSPAAKIRSSGRGKDEVEREGLEHGESHAEVEADPVCDAALVVEKRIGEVETDRGVDHGQFDAQSVTDADVRRGEGTEA